MSGLKREVGLFGAIATAVGIVVSSSVLVMAAQGFGFGGTAFVVAMVVALLINLFVAFSFAELTSMMPLAGGINHYTLPAMGPTVGIFSVLCGYFAVSVFSNAAESSIAGLVISDILFPGANISPALGAFLLMVILTLINIRGVKTFAISQMIFAGVMIFSMVTLSAIGLLGLGSGEPLPTRLTFDMAAGGGVLALLGIAFWLFVGMEFVCPMAEEVKSPQRFIPIAMISALLIIFVSNMLFGLMALKYLGMDALASSAYPHVDAASAVLGRTGQIWIGIISLVATASTLNTFIAAVPRMLYGMARQGQFPKAFGRLNKYGSPYIGVIFIFIITVALLVTGIGTVDAIVTLILAGCIGWMITYIIAHIDVLILRKKYPGVKRSFTVPGGSLIPIIGIVGLAYMIAAIWPEPVVRNQIYLYAGLFIIVFAGWSVYWVKFVMKRPLFKTISMEEILKEASDSLATENTAISKDYSM
jgi:amino acid transporter